MVDRTNLQPSGGDSPSHDDPAGPDFLHGLYAVLAAFAITAIVSGALLLVKIGLTQLGFRADFLFHEEVLRWAAWVLLLFAIVKLTKSKWRDIAPMRSFPAKSVVPLVVLCWCGALVYAQLASWIMGSDDTGNVAELRNQLDPARLPGLLIFAPLIEELIFRGWMLRGFRAHYSTRNAIIMSAFLFALVHILPRQMILPFLAGLLNAWLVVATGSIVPAIIAHVALNSAPRLFFAFARAHYTDEQLVAMPSIPLAVFAIAAVAGTISAIALKRTLARNC